MGKHVSLWFYFKTIAKSITFYKFHHSTLQRAFLVLTNNIQTSTKESYLKFALRDTKRN